MGKITYEFIKEKTFQTINNVELDDSGVPNYEEVEEVELIFNDTSIILSRENAELIYSIFNYCNCFRIPIVITHNHINPLSLKLSESDFSNKKFKAKFDGSY